MPYSFDDTDPYKTIEGASYVLQTYPDKKLKAYIDSVLDIIAPAQEADGYLYTARTQNRSILISGLATSAGAWRRI